MSPAEKRHGGKPRQRLRYWLTSLVILAATLALKPYLNDWSALQGMRNALFRLLVQSPTNPAQPRAVKLVAIGDDEFWNGPLAHRMPTDRTYLAQLIYAADHAEAGVIALDFDLRLSHPGKAVWPGRYSAIDEPYRKETGALIRAIDDVAKRRPIVLAKTIKGPVNGPFALEADAYQVFGICSSLSSTGHWDNPGTKEFPLTEDARGNINCGYIALMSDKRRVPPPARIIGSKSRIDAFPLALVRAHHEEILPRFEGGEYYASYIPQEAIKNPAFVLPAASLLSDPKHARAMLQSFPVIIGAEWHLRAYGEGELVDAHATPIGVVSGALVHENIAEAVLSNRTYHALPEWVSWAVEILLGLLAAWLFSLLSSWWVGVALLAVAVAIIFLVQWITLQLFGTFVEVLIPVLLLWLHAILDRIVGSGH